MKIDRARIQLGRISPFGLLELSRQRLRPSLVETNFETCRHCTGTGLVRTTGSAALHVLRAIEEEGIRKRAREILVHAPTPIALVILNQKRDSLAEIESRYGFRVFVRGRRHADRPPTTAWSGSRRAADRGRSRRHRYGPGDGRDRCRPGRGGANRRRRGGGRGGSGGGPPRGPSGRGRGGGSGQAPPPPPPSQGRTCRGDRSGGRAAPARSRRSRKRRRRSPSRWREPPARPRPQGKKVAIDPARSGAAASAAVAAGPARTASRGDRDRDRGDRRRPAPCRGGRRPRPRHSRRG